VIAEKEPASTSTGVAALLRETRLKLGRDIGVAATTLRIRQPYLQAIEEGRFQDLPGATYAVGFVRGYADYLGLDGAEIVRRFKQENSDLSGRAELVFPSATSGGGIPTGALLVLALVGAGIAYGVWVWLQDRNDSVAESVPPLPERLAALIHKPVDTPSDSPAASPAPQTSEQNTPPAPLVAANTQPDSPVADNPPQPAVAPAQPQPEPAPVAMTDQIKPAKASKAKKADTPPAPTPAPPSADGDNPGTATPAMLASAETPPAAPQADAPKKVVWKPSKRVKITANADCWIKIRDAEGQMVLSRLLHAGDSFSPPGNPGLVMTVGNAAALTMIVDGKERPALGAEGVVKHIALDPDKTDGAETPEPTTPGSND